MEISKIAKDAKGILRNNTPAILAGIGVGGVVATGIMSARAGMKASQIIEEDRARQGAPEDPRARLKNDAKLTWQCYIPAASVAVTTITAIVAGQQVSARRQASMVGLYSITERAFKEYKDEVLKVVGEEKAEAIEEATAARTLARHPEEDRTIVFGAGKVACFDTLSGRYFESDFESIRAAANDLNAQCIDNVYASQNDWFRLLGLPLLPNGDDLGWNTNHRIDVRITSTMTPDNKPALCIKYGNTPHPNYSRGFGW